MRNLYKFLPKSVAVLPVFAIIEEESGGLKPSGIFRFRIDYQDEKGAHTYQDMETPIYKFNISSYEDLIKLEEAMLSLSYTYANLNFPCASCIRNNNDRYQIVGKEYYQTAKMGMLAIEIEYNIEGETGRGIQLNCEIGSKDKSMNIYYSIENGNSLTINTYPIQNYNLTLITKDETGTPLGMVTNIPISFDGWYDDETNSPKSVTHSLKPIMKMMYGESTVKRAVKYEGSYYPISDDSVFVITTNYALLEYEVGIFGNPLIVFPATTGEMIIGLWSL